MKTDQASLEKVTGRRRFPQAVVVGVTDDEAGEDEEKVDS